MTDKSGMWFLELILNIFLLGAVAFVTFAARGEQERGVAVPLFAGVSGNGKQSVTSALVPPSRPAAGSPGVPGAGNLPAVNLPNAQAVQNNVQNSVQNGTAAVNQNFQQAWGALQIWAAGLDGKITKEELDKIMGDIQVGWTSVQSPRDYLKNINQRINAGQTDQVIQESLQTIAQQTNEKKTMVLNSVMQSMRENGISLEQTQQVLSRWVTEVLKLRPLDLWQSMKP